MNLTANIRHLLEILLIPTSEIGTTVRFHAGSLALQAAAADARRERISRVNGELCRRRVANDGAAAAGTHWSGTAAARHNAHVDR